MLRPLVFGLKAGKRKETKVEIHTIPLPSFTPAFFMKSDKSTIAIHTQVMTPLMGSVLP